MRPYRRLRIVLFTVAVLAMTFNTLLPLTYTSRNNSNKPVAYAADAGENPETAQPAEAGTGPVFPGQEDPTGTPAPEPSDVPPDPTEPAAPEVSETPVPKATEPPPTVPAETPAPAVTEAPPTIPAETPAPAVTEAPSPTPTAVPDAGPAPAPLLASAAECQFEITDAGDADPMTFRFTASGVGISQYSWDFGDSSTATSAGPYVHTYGTAGSFVVTLTCTPVTGDPIVLTGSVDTGGMISPVASFTVDNDYGVGTLVLHTTNNSSGASLTYLWEITGPETYTSADFEPVFTLTSVGTYTISLTVTDTASGLMSKAWRTVLVIDYPPDATFTVSPNLGQAPLLVTIDPVINPGSGPITSWTWDFGDGSPLVVNATPQQLTHTYTANGTYWITLDYVGPGGSGQVAKQVYVDDLSGTVEAQFTYVSNGNVSGGVEICFTNTSLGVVTKSTWDFGDGSPLVVDNSAVVCHVYNVTTIQNFVVTLVIEGITPSITSTATQTIVVIAGPVAEFTADSFTVIPGQAVNFTDLSTGIITGWFWEFGDGQTSTAQNPSHSYALGGTYTIRLTVTGPGGTSYTEKIVTVSVSAIGCNFTGSLTPYPGQTINYVSSVTNLLGRTISAYGWYIDGVQVATTANLSRLWPTEGTYSLQFTAQTADGASCSQTKTVNVQWGALGCSLSGDPAPVPNGTVYTYTASVTNRQGRAISYRWFVDGVEQIGQTGATFTRSWTVETTEIISFEATGSPTGSCNASRTVVVQWPVLTCSISGNQNPIPQLPDDPTRSYTYTANVSGLAGRTATYTWWVDRHDGNGFVVQPGETGPTLTLFWAWTEEGPYDVKFDVVSSVNAASCQVAATLSLNVAVPALQCLPPIGDPDPVIGDDVTYLPNVVNAYGRTSTGYTWVLLDGAAVVASGSTPTFSYLFGPLDAGKTYILRYTTGVLDPAESCSAEKPITVAQPGQGFTCGDQGNTWDPASNFAPASPTASYTYGIYVDNYTGIPLTYTWQLVPDGWGGGARVLATLTSSADGLLQQTFSGADLGPIGTYQLVVEVVDPADPTHTYDCSFSHALVTGTISVNYTYTVNPNAVAVGEQICLTNVSSTSHGTIDDLSYTWDLGSADNTLGVATYTGRDLPCFSYTVPNGTGYSIRLTGSANGLTASAVYVFKVFGLQSISISKSNHTQAPANMSFSATGVNIFPGSYTWEFYQGAALLGTRSGQSVTFFFANPGIYTAVVRGMGSLGQTSASVQFELTGINDIRAAFTPSIYGGIAPMTVCFTDQSVGSTINYWEWDFGDGSPHLIYTPATKPASICHTYVDAGRVFLVSLLVRNAALLQATATNELRTYTLLESRSSFSITPMGSGQYCFTAILPPGTGVIFWDFGDGTEVYTGDTTICHTYQAEGNYVVRMGVQNSAGEEGVVIRSFDATVDPVPTPRLEALMSCSAARVLSFSITNTGGDMTVTDEIRVIADGVVVYIDALRLNAGETAAFTVPDVSGSVQLTLVDNVLAGTVTTACEYPPDITVTPDCAGSQVRFTIHNADGPMITPQSYEIRDAVGTVVLSGSFQIPRGGADVELLVPNPYGPYTFISSGVVGTFNMTHQCNVPPALAISTNACGAVVQFTVTNTGGDMVAAQGFTVTQDGADVTGSVSPGSSFLLASGASQTFALPASFDPYAAYVFTTGGYAGTHSATHDCGSPALAISTNACGAVVQFTVTNTGSDMLIPQGFTVTQDGADVTGSVSPGSSFLLASGASQTFALPASFDPYAAYVFTTGGYAGTHSATHDCGNTGLVVTTNACGAVVEFTVTNLDSDMLIPQGFTVTQDGVDVTGSVSPGSSFLLASGASQTFALPASFDPYAEYIFATSGYAGTRSVTHDCDGPALSVTTNQCSATVEFTITNDSTGGAMLVEQPFQVIRDGEEDVTPAPGVFMLAPGESITIVLPAESNPYALYRLISAGFAADLEMVHDCPEADLTISANCGTPVSFTVANPGAAMLVPQPFTITPGTGYTLVPGAGTFQLKAGEDITFLLEGADPMIVYVFHTALFGVESSSVLDCRPGSGETETGAVEVADRSGAGVRGTPGRLTIADEARTLLPAWEGVSVCGHSCPTWLLYHTNLTGDWEIFRLDGYDAESRQTSYVNLSQGRGPGIDDMAPSRSPDEQWIVFASNRDGNWEIYLAPTDGDESRIQRLTYNQVAIDTDPIWGPTNFIAYESTRDGNWELYLMDMTTGREYRLTDSPSSEINPFWSPDGARLVFQSDESGQWQLYEVDLRTFEVTRLSDGSGQDVDPQYSFDGRSIAFRSYRDGARSVIYLMNADGTNPRPITDLNGDATNQAWSPNDRLIAYQSDLDGDLDIYIYEVGTGQTRKLTGNDIADYAPMWRCDSTTVVFTSEIAANPDIFEASALPVTADPLDLLKDAHQMTFEDAQDIYPESMPPEENASREGRLPSQAAQPGAPGTALGWQTDFLKPDTSLTPPDVSRHEGQAREFRPIQVCPAP